MEETTRVELHLPSDVVAVIQKGEHSTLEERVKTSIDYEEDIDSIKSAKE
jgi:hypothetical protein